MGSQKHHYTEQELIAGCRQGEARAQEALYNRYAAAMLGVCLRYIKDRSAAEATMVKGFMQVYSKIGQFSGQGSFEGWLRKVMVNHSLMYLRQHSNFQVTSPLSNDGPEPISDNQADGQLAAQELLAMVQQLPAGYRAVFNLYAIEGYSHKEIAVMLEISEGTSKSQLSKARQMLRQLLAKQSQAVYGREEIKN